MPKFNSVNQYFKYNGTHYNFEALKKLALTLLNNDANYLKEIGDFLLQWQNNSETIILKTSGSTGVPKPIVMQKQAMVNSAIATGLHFNLNQKDKALLCLPAHYIAGKMMLVRALVIGLELDSIEPKANLFIDLDKQYKFAAMVPMQLENNLDKLNNIKVLIVGGAQVSSGLHLKLQHLKTNVFETYGMTETVTHIAVKQLNNGNAIKKNSFKILPNIIISQDERQCLVVEAPKLSEKIIITNDVVLLHSKNDFEWLGRADNIINSGGIKIFPEQLEAKLKPYIKERFFIASKQHKILGEQIVLIVESITKPLDTAVFKNLKYFEKPKQIFNVSKFVETTSGKIKRKETLKKIA